MASELALAGSHWRFALSVYGKPGVAECCLSLQDRYGVDVNVLLMALFSARVYGAALDDRALADIDRAVRAWRDEVVRPLRSIRRRLKYGPAPAPDLATEALRTAVKDAELRAEQIELAVIASRLENRTAQTGEMPDPGEIIRQVVTHYRRTASEAASTGLDLAIDIDTSALDKAVQSYCPERDDRR